MSERLKDFGTFEKSRAVLEKYVGNVDNISKVEKVLEIIGSEEKYVGNVDNISKVEKVLEIIGSEEKLNECFDAVWAVECAGMENYAQQIQQFVNGFRSCEAPYIYAGMKELLDVALSAPPFTNPDMRQKYDMLLETLEKDMLRVIITQKAKREP